MPTPPVPLDGDLRDAVAAAVTEDALKPRAERIGLVNAMLAVVQPLLAALDAEIHQLQEQLAQQQTPDLRTELDGLKRAMAAPLPDPEEIAAGKAEDRALSERIHRARPGVPLHHAFAVLESLREINRIEAARTATAQEG